MWQGQLPGNTDLLASIDVGSNTIRLLIGQVSQGNLSPQHYFRRITRLGGGMSLQKGLAPESMERTLFALKEATSLMAQAGVDRYRAVATEAVRKASNSQEFLERVRHETGLCLEVISGEEEAYLSCLGVLAAIEPQPRQCLIFDIGGGSTEFVFWHENQVRFRASYPLGVVRLCEDHSGISAQKDYIACVIRRLFADFDRYEVKNQVLMQECSLIGTAGTVTTLAAADLKLLQYDWKLVNNHILAHQTLVDMLETLELLSSEQREQLPGIEPGRGDLIVPGLLSVLSIMEALGQDRLIVSDFGLLEGTLLDLADFRQKGQMVRNN